MSFPQIQWIQYLEQTDICVDSAGVRHRIEHGYFRGEYEFENIKPDGYLFINGEHLFFEFLGKPLLVTLFLVTLFLVTPFKKIF